MSLGVLTFRGGVHAPHRKNDTRNKAIEIMKAPGLVYIPLQQHIGAACQPLVKPGDVVKLGQKIGEPGGFVGAPVHASVSGIVKDIRQVPHPSVGSGLAVVIENDGKDEPDDSITPGDISSMDADRIKELILEAGIVGMGGAAFPTHVKLSPPKEKPIDTVILNGAECEPYLTADHRLMLEAAEDVADGLKVIMKVLGVERAYIAIEDNKPDAVRIMTDTVKEVQGVDVTVLKTKYPQGAEKQLIYVVTGRQVPSGGLPMDVGVIVSNVGTSAAIARAIKTGMPLVERVVTVTGSGVAEPKNLMVRIGTSFMDVIQACGGFVEEPAKVISGGPMMGIGQYTLDVPVIKGTSGILVLTREEAKIPDVEPCIRCAKCVDACPMGLMPLMISAYALKEDYDNSEKFHAMDCIECGCCSYSCPAKRPLVQSIRVAKKMITDKRKRAAG
ncbi:MAG: electron transport complex subunit RsxC [Clostridiales bacterium]|nr:electron transport complex subunit RsxC [Clostridiales bacterium]